MKKRKLLLSVGAFFFTVTISSQVGINTTNPAVTLDITAQNATGNFKNADGLLIPRVDRGRAQNMTGIPISTLIYVNGIVTGDTTGNAVNIDAVGYYYYSGTVWEKLITPASANTNIYVTDGNLNENRKVIQGNKTLAFSGTAINAFSIGGATFSVDAANDRVGMGTIAPQTKLDITTSTKAYGFQHTDGTVKLRSFVGKGSTNGDTDAGWLGTQSNHPLDFMTSDTAKMRIETNGNVGINISTPHATLEVASAPGNSSKADGIIPPRLKGTELKTKDGAYGIDQTGAIIYVTEGLAAAAITAKTKNVTVPGYYYFNGTEWMRFNDVGAAPLTKVAFNGMGSAESAMIAGGMYKKLSFPVTNITADAQIGTWNSVTSEMTVSKKGVYTITASLVYQNVATTGGATLIVRGGSDSDSSSSVAVAGSVAPYTQRNNITSIMVLNAGEKIWIEGVRNNSGWSVGKRSLNITFSEIN
ncbi:hypothetical protein [Chryseobacterium vrystaatense]|uniref:C1q domain-containing protein n=1 Tax=Chryseobacterium vrystaatense TaxID=307480 RepID=A0A1M5DNG5_9FLAO|nr:hypothetical protein [Chryseobacterium vrystaatense]SHF68539.1 hypothetical protein SAMN02787073_2664 [Chryseobacterium vrystaatense]